MESGKPTGDSAGRLADPSKRVSRPTAFLLGGALSAAALALAGCGQTTTAAGDAASYASQHFHSRPDLRPPAVHVLTRAHGTAPGYLFLGPKKIVEQAGPLIMDDDGQPVWFRPLDTHRVADVAVQRYRGRPVLTWWRGETTSDGNGHYVVADDHYRTLAKVYAANGRTGDLHEFLLTPRKTALITIFQKVPYDLPFFGGTRKGNAIEGVIQEVDVATGRLLFEWRSLDHVPPSESYEDIPTDLSRSWDYFHLNSIEIEPDGNLLVSARNTHAMYLIRRSDGAVLWRLGGKRSDFTFDPGARFAWQHDGRLHPDEELTVFDNQAVRPSLRRRSRALLLRLDEQHRRVRLIRRYTLPKPVLSTSQGNAQLLPDGHVLVGWGSNPRVTEFSRRGRILLDLTFGGGAANSYRAFRFPWTGHPTDLPAAAVAGARKRVVVYASWNGATEVAAWRVLAGPTAATCARSRRPARPASRRRFRSRRTRACSASPLSTRPAGSWGCPLASVPAVRLTRAARLLTLERIQRQADDLPRAAELLPRAGRTGCGDVERIAVVRDLELPVRTLGRSEQALVQARIIVRDDISVRYERRPRRRALPRTVDPAGERVERFAGAVDEQRAVLRRLDADDRLRSRAAPAARCRADGEQREAGHDGCPGKHLGEFCPFLLSGS